MRRELILNNDGTVTARVSGDVEPYMEVAKAMRDNAPMLGARFKKTFTHAAVVPKEIIEKIKNEDGVNFFDKNDHKKFLQILHDKYPVFLTLPGKVLTGRGRGYGR